MATAGSPAAAQAHPSPHGSRVPLLALFFGVMGGPLAWTLQLLVNYALASHACFPRNRPLGQILVGWGWTWDLLLAVNLLMLLVSLAAGLVSFRAWQLLHEEAPGSMGELLEAGEGRARFMASCGILTSFGFFAAIAFNTIALFVVPLCTG